MATHRIPPQGQFSQPYNYQNFEQDSTRLPMRPNIGLAAGMVGAFVAIIALIVYYVL
jgi:hypothetical protein